MSENREATFIARLTSSTTHELRNVLSIVQETAGLMDDLVGLWEGEGGLAPSPDRLRQLTSLIGKQVDRGSALITSLHELAHSLDPGPGGEELAPHVARVAAFSERLARQRHQRVEVGSGDADVTVAMNALPLQMVLFAAVEYGLGRLPEGGVMTLTPRRSLGGVGVGFTDAAKRVDGPGVEIVGEAEEGEPAGEETAGDAWSRLEAEVGGLGATVEAGPGTLRLWMGLPGVDP